MKFPKLPPIKDLRTLPKGTLKITLGIIITVVIAQLLFGQKGFVSLIMVHQDCSRIEREIAAEKSRIDSLKIVVTRLKSDRSYLERSARELLGVSDSSETVIKFVDPKE